MNTVSIALAVVTVYATIWALHLVLLPILAALRRPRARPPGRDSDGACPTFAVIVPAHNMAKFIERCIRSLQACRYPAENVEIYVVTDHCSDDTAKRAEAAGATVLTREEGPAGKTYTLAWTMDTLKQRKIAPDLHLIVDATVRVEPDFLNAFAHHWRNGEDIVVCHPIVDAENSQWFARCLGLTLVHRNLQNWARQRLGFSALIEGRGMAYSRSYIDRYGWSLAAPKTGHRSSHPTEDWRHGVQVVEQGLRVAFADDARLFTPLRDSLSAATQQGARWERGRMANAATHALRLLLRGLGQRNPLKVMAALDAIQPPVAILGGICVAAAALSFFAFDTPFGIVSSSVPLILIFLYGLMVVARGRSDGIKATTVIWAPVYVAWRCAAFALAWAFLDRLDLSKTKKGEPQGPTNSK